MYIPPHPKPAQERSSIRPTLPSQRSNTGNASPPPNSCPTQSGVAPKLQRQSQAPPQATPHRPIAQTVPMEPLRNPAPLHTPAPSPKTAQPWVGQLPTHLPSPHAHTSGTLAESRGRLHDVL
jgi:hypothetical protein